MSLFDLFIYFFVTANFFSNRSLGTFFHGFRFRFRFRESVSESRIPCFRSKQVSGSFSNYGEQPSGVEERQGHPMDLFLKISVLHANFCWLGDVEEIIDLGRKVLLGKR